jgi:hypothetical protein
VKHLEQHPLDTEAREKLAIIYARHYKRLDLATLELNQLINEPNQPPKLVAHWLNLLADLQIAWRRGLRTVRRPGKNRRRVSRTAGGGNRTVAAGPFETGNQRAKETPGAKLGVYEQNIGLKCGSPH